ncbi:hypothetical protein ACTA71_008870 [Dictyostelium dimigraforme]
MDQIKYYEYKNDSNIKEKFLKQIGLSITTEVKTVQDISKIQQAFGKFIPYDNSDLIINGNNFHDVEYCVERILNKGLGGTCVHMTIIMGLFLVECGFKVQLTRSINSEKNLADIIQYHYTNIVVIDDKRYLVDASMGALNSYIPIELGAIEPVEFSTTNYRVISLEDGTYSFDQKKINQTEFVTTFRFVDEKVEASKIEQSQWEYRNHKGAHLFLFIMNQDGSHNIIMKNCLTTISNFSAPILRPLTNNNDYKEVLENFNNYPVSLNDIDFYGFALKKSQDNQN